MESAEQKKGDVASQFVVNEIVSLIESKNILPIDKITTTKLIQEVQQKLINRLKQHPEEEGMGTTLAMLYFHNRGVTVCHIGDSRVYFIQPSQHSYWHTKDHSIVQELVDAGVIEEKDMAKHPMSNRITKAFQAKKDVSPLNPSVTIIPSWTKEDIFFLCTDGVLEPFENDEFLSYLWNMKQPIQARLEAIKKRCAKDSSDNNTCILVSFR